ncbi:MAG: DUF899 domain-containing protein [Granulosicoccus sp.]
MTDIKVVDKQTWLNKRLELLQKEKAFTQLRDQLSRERRELPWVAVEKNYCFTDADSKYTLSELFGNKSQLIVYHFMYGKDWQLPCKSCSFWADNFNGIDLHLAQRDIAFCAVSSAPIENLDAFRERMGWSFKWLSSGDCDFNQDYQVTFSEQQKQDREVVYNYKHQPWFIDEMVGISVFAKDRNGQLFHTYSTYSRGTDMLNGAYNYMDITPKGRDEGDSGMSWLCFRDQY